MKTSTVGLVLAAILMVLAGVGSGIAQAAGNQSYDPMVSYDLLLSFGDQDVNPYTQPREAVETGSLPDDSIADSSIVEIDGVSYYYFEGNLYGP